MLTSDSITDEDIRELQRRVRKTIGTPASARVFDLCHVALQATMGSMRRIQARGECARIINEMP